MKESIRKIPLEFWLGQAVVVISTVVGVYLAATVGFQKAVELTLFTSDRSTYYLGQSYKAELDSNAEQLLGFMDRHADAPFMPENERLSLNLYVFNTMKEADSTFELPPAVLNGVSEFYQEAGSLIGELNARQLNKQSGFQRLREITEQVRQDESAQMGDFVEQLRARLSAQGIAL